MRATAIVPVKRFAAAKQRLAETLAPPQRAALAAAMLGDVLAAIGRCTNVERTLVVSGEPAVVPIASERGADLLVDPDDAGHSQAAAIGVATALDRGAIAVALLPGDCPLLDPDELDAALDRLEPGTVAVVPDRHGTGTNGLLLSPPDAIAPAFGEGSHERHLRLAREAGNEARTAELASLALDLDTGSDLEELRAELRALEQPPAATARALGGVDPGSGRVTS